MYQMNANPNRLQATSNGNGIWWFDLLPLGNELVYSSNKKIEIFPSPVISGQPIHWKISSEMKNAQVTIVDAKGRLVTRNFISCSSDQIQEITTTGFSSGVYYLVIQNGDDKFNGQFVIR